jgi:Na+-translocating ferredoxin:NAD+ oxidoreductase RNF subunit RnfB
MEWLRLPAALLIVFICALGETFITGAWERRRRRSETLDRLMDVLPKHDCGLCGQPDCRSYARSLLEDHGDPGLCAPGGARTESELRGNLSDQRSRDRVAFVRCGGSFANAELLYSYDGRPDCRAAAACYQGPKRCPDACIGLGSCVHICGVGAIRVVDGVAKVDPALCTGCGRCAGICPTGSIEIIVRSAEWRVACNSSRPAEEKAKDCKSACIACGECVHYSEAWEFSISSNLAKASETVPASGVGAGEWKSIAEKCPTGAIVHACGIRGASPESSEPPKKR